MLQSRVGVWDVECAYHMGADEPMHVSAVETVEALGPFWTVSLFECELPGGIPLVGRASVGFDTNREKFHSTWIDSATPYLYTFDGEYDREARALRLEGMNTDPASGNRIKYKGIEAFGHADHRTFELLIEPRPGIQQQLLRYEYTRRA